MLRKSTYFAATILLAGGLALGYLGWRVVGSRAAAVCLICSRPVHSESRTVALIDGRNAMFCCPACALTVQRQSGKAVKLIALTDYETRAELAPDRAYIVENSDLNHCARTAALLDQTKTPHHVQFDRCSPGYLAFARRPVAENFLKNHGGRLMRLSELVAHQP